MSGNTDRRRQARFEAITLPHLDAAYALARWLTRNDADAADVVQEAFLRAFRYFDSYRGDDAKSWVLRSSGAPAIAGSSAIARRTSSRSKRRRNSATRSRRP
jgi:DNA-directed RNA polymerase specialized sigma24 family protein